MTITQEPLTHKQSKRAWNGGCFRPWASSPGSLGGLMAGPSNRTAEVQQNDNAAFLPEAGKAGHREARCAGWR